MTETPANDTVSAEPSGKIKVTKFQTPSSAAYGVNVTLDEEGRVQKVVYPGRDTEFELTFQDPGQSRDIKNLYTVKAFDPGGVLVQLPYEEAINNDAGAPGTQAGIRFYERKGYLLLWDFDREVGVYCPAWGCWAAWDNQRDGFCCQAHKDKAGRQQNPGQFGVGATTSQSAWRRT